jgi:hypothetical protein
MTSNETIKQAVMAGMGLSFLSLHTHGLGTRIRLDRHLGRGGHANRAGLERGAHPVQNALASAEAFRYFMLEHAEGQLADQYGARIPMKPTR